MGSLGRDDFIPEELLLSSVLIPKKKPNLMTIEPDVEENAKMQQIKHQRSDEMASTNQVRLDLLYRQLEEEQTIFEENSLRATEASRRIIEILAKMKNFQTTYWEVAESSISRLSSRSSMAEVSNENRQLLTNISIVAKPKYLRRKPRSLLFSKHAEDVLFTSTLDGTIQTWSLNKKGVESSTYLPTLLDQPFFAEDIAFNHRGTHLAIALGESNSVTPTATNPAALASESVSDYSSNCSRLVLIPTRTDRSMPVILEPTFPVHTKSIVTVESFNNGTSDKSLFITGGNDRTVAVWEVDDTSFDVQVKEVHRRHTSAIHAIAQQVSTPVIWTGGNDTRIVGYNLDCNQLVLERRFPHRLAHILTNQNNPHSLLMTQCKTEEQLVLLDTRSKQTLDPFGWLETANISRYLKPSWHSDGNLVACGASQPTSKMSGIMIWDLRYISQSSSPLQVIEGQGERRYLRAEFHPSKNLLVSLATDGSVSFIDFNISQ